MYMNSLASITFEGVVKFSQIQTTGTMIAHTLGMIMYFAMMRYYHWV
jgi:hypothetical protein